MTLKEFFKNDRFAAEAGCELLEVSEGYARARMLGNHPNFDVF